MKLLGRLRCLAEDYIPEFEARRAARTGPSSPGETERDARILNELVKLVDRMAAIEHRARGE